MMFTDLVASTELAVAHGARYDEARRAHDALLRTTVEAHAGSVVKGTGDGVLATFAGVGDGVDAARAVQQAIHRLNHRQREPVLSIRVGLSVGDISFEGGDCYGEAVIEAARLCALAHGDQILATAVVQALTGGSRATGFAPVGPLDLKGLPDPVEVVAVEWERPVASATPLPARLAGEPTTFVGRANELDQLHRAFHAVRDGGNRRVLLVGGEPGVGKTTVVSQAIHLWFDGGATIAMGRCEEDVRAPYRPFADALRHLVSSAPADVLAAHVERHGSNLLPLVPGLRQRVEGLPEPTSTDPESERFLLFAAADDLLAALGAVVPVVVFLDDLHWADAGTASLLRSLATGSDPAKLLVVGTHRSDELSPDHPMGQAMAAFRRVDAVSRLQLDGLRPPDVVELVERWTGTGGGEGAARLAHDLVAETGGNAFFVTEVIRHLQATGQLDGLAGRPLAGGSLVPDSVREVLAERVARLGSAADAVLAAAAVIGKEFALPLLAAVTSVAEEKLLGVLGDAAAAALVREVVEAPGRFVFTHDLVQHAILVNLGATREAALHRRVAEVLEDGQDHMPSVAELAHHWLQATNVSDMSRARDWAIQAGDAALTALAPGDAVAYFRQALLLHDQLRDEDVAMRIDLLTKLGTAERQAGDPEHRDTLLKAGRLARRLDDADRLTAAALANNSGTFSRFKGVDHERIEMLETAVATSTGGRRALLLSTLANELTYAGDYRRRRDLVDEALLAARTTGDGDLLLRVMNLAFYALWIPETLDERLALTDESRALAEGCDDPLPRFWAASSGFLNLVQTGRVAEADAELRTTGALADRLAQPALQWRARHTEATRRLLAGDPDGAEPLAAEALHLGEQAGEPEASVYFKSQEMGIRWQRGTMGELGARIKGTTPRPPNAVASVCVIFGESDRDEEAARLLEGEAARGFADLPRDPAFITSGALFSEAAIRLDDPTAAALLYDLLVPFASQIGFDGVMTVGGLEHYLGGLAGTLGRSDEAVRRLERSRDLHRAISAPFFEARDRLQLAIALLDRGEAGDGPSARAELERAVELADAHGYRAVHRRARERLASGG